VFESWGASSGRGHGERVKREPITGVWGRSPQRGPGAEPLVGDQGSFAPEAESFLVLERPTERQNSKMSKSIRLSLTSQCTRLKLLGEQELWPALPCQKLGEQLLPLLPLFQRPCDNTIARVDIARLNKSREVHSAIRYHVVHSCYASRAHSMVSRCQVSRFQLPQLIGLS